LEQLVARDVLACLDDLRQPPVTHPHHVLLAALATEPKLEGLAGDVDMAIAQSGEPEGLVGAGILLVAHAHQGGLEQAHDGGEHLVPWQSRPPEVSLDTPAQSGQALAECDQLPILGRVAHGPPAQMVAVLLA
jgi:hypothetical protein